MYYLMNKDLSLKAKGMLAMMLHLQEGSVIVHLDAVKHYAKESMVKLTDTFRELQSHGYLILTRGKDGNIGVTAFSDSEIKE
jgi:hypothetical protein